MKTFLTAFKVFLFFTLLTGVIYPLGIHLIAQWCLPHFANGSLISANGKVVGSELIAQPFKEPKYFWPRPSAVDYNPLPSGGSNFSPTSKDLLAKVNERRALGFPHEMLFSSASGLDPHISLEAATSQIERVAAARSISRATVQELVEGAYERRQFELFGEPRINVLLLNLSLDRLR